MRIDTMSPTVLVSYPDYSGDGGMFCCCCCQCENRHRSERFEHSRNNAIPVSPGHVLVGGADGVIRSTLLDGNDNVYWSIVDPSQPDTASVMPVPQFPWNLGMVSV